MHMVVILSLLVHPQREKAGHIFWQALHSVPKEGSVIRGMSYCLLAQLVSMLEPSFSLKHLGHFLEHSYRAMFCPLCSKILQS